MCPFRKHKWLWINFTCFGANESENRYNGKAKAGQPPKRGRSVLGSSWMTKALMPLTGPHVPLTQIQLGTYETLCYVDFKCSHRLTQELTDALIQVWEEIPLDTIYQLSRSMPRGYRECIQARGGHTHYWVTLWVAVMKFTQVGSAVISIFYFDFRCDFKSSPQWVDDFGFSIDCYYVIWFSKIS